MLFVFDSHMKGPMNHIVDLKIFFTEPQALPNLLPRLVFKLWPGQASLHLVFSQIDQTITTGLGLGQMHFFLKHIQ